MVEDRVKWNARYEARNACDRFDPAAMLAAEIHRVCPPGDALDLACGLGRNALFMASRGFNVTGVDISSVALAGAHQRASAAELDITWEEADLDTYRLPKNRYALITCINFLDRNLFAQFPGSLRPGGALVYQAIMFEPGSDRSSHYRVAPNELLTTILDLDLRVVAYHEGRLEGMPAAAIVAIYDGLAR